MKSLAKKIALFVSLSVASVLMVFGSVFFATDGFGSGMVSRITNSQIQADDTSNKLGSDSVDAEGNLTGPSQDSETQTPPNSDNTENKDTDGDNYGAGSSQATITAYYCNTSFRSQSVSVTMKYNTIETYVSAVHVSGATCLGFFVDQYSTSRQVGTANYISYAAWLAEGCPSTVYAIYSTTRNYDQTVVHSVEFHYLDSNGNPTSTTKNITKYINTITPSDYIRFYSCNWGFIEDKTYSINMYYWYMNVSDFPSVPSTAGKYTFFGWENGGGSNGGKISSTHAYEVQEYDGYFFVHVYAIYYNSSSSSRNITFNYSLSSGSTAISIKTLNTLNCTYHKAYAGGFLSVNYELNENSLTTPSVASSVNNCTFQGWATSSTSTTVSLNASYSGSTVSYSGTSNNLYAVYYGTYTNKSLLRYTSASFVTMFDTAYVKEFDIPIYNTKTGTGNHNYNFSTCSNGYTTTEGVDFSFPTASDVKMPSGNYELIGWIPDYADEEGGYSNFREYSVEEGSHVTNFDPEWFNTTFIYALYEAEIGYTDQVDSSFSKTKTINFDWNGANGNFSSKTIDITKTITYVQTGIVSVSGVLYQDTGSTFYSNNYFGSLTLPTADDANYLFANLVGWATSKSSTTAAYDPGAVYSFNTISATNLDSSTALTASMTLYAVWTGSSPSSSGAVTTFQVTNNEYYYDGYSHLATIAVSHNGTALSSSYYTVTYKNSSGTTVTNPTSAGTYTITVSGTTSYPSYTTYTAGYLYIYKDTIDYGRFTIEGEYVRRGGSYGTSTLYKTYTGSSMYPTAISIYGENYSGAIPTSGYTVTPSTSNNNFINVGTVTLKVEGKGNFEGSFSFIIEIYRRDVNDYNFTLSAYNFTYSNTNIEPTVYSDELVRGTDFYVEYSNNRNATTSTSKAKAIVYGMGSYTGSKEIEFEIEKATLDSVTATVKIGSSQYSAVSTKTSTGTLTITYQAQAMIPSYSVVANGVSVGTNYFTASYSRTGDSTTAGPYTNAGTTTITITAKDYNGIDNFTGSLTINYVIEKKAINASDVTLTLSSDAFYYTRTAKTPTVTITYNGVTLRSGTSGDYTISYHENINVGTNTAYAYISANNVNYSGERYKYFTIYAATIQTAYFTKQSTGLNSSTAYGVSNGGTLSETYSRTEDAFKFVRVHTTSVTDIDLRDGEFTITYKRGTVDSKNNLRNSGTITVTITANSSNFSGSITFTLEILKKSLDFYSSYFSISPTSYVYDGNRKYPTVTCSHPDNLIVDIEYTITYSNNLNAGTGIVEIEAVASSNFSGSVTKTFTINKAQLTYVIMEIDGVEYEFSAINNKIEITYKRDNFAITVKRVLDASRKDFTNGTSYYKVTQSRTDVRNQGSIVYTIDSAPSSGIYNYEGTLQVTITIARLNISNFKDTFSLIFTDPMLGFEYYNYGAEIKPAVITSDWDISSYYSHAQFSVAYSNNINSTSRAIVTVTGTDNYNGSFELYFEIKPIKLDTTGVVFVGNDSGITYNSIEDLFETTYDKLTHKIVVSNLSAALTDTKFGITVSYTVTNMSTGRSVDENSLRDAFSYQFVAHFNPRDTLNFYTEPATKTAIFRINPKSINASDLGPSMFILSYYSVVYTGLANEPDVWCLDDDVVKGSGFLIDHYEDNINVTDRAKVIIRGINNYTDEMTLYFEITPAKLGDVFITINSSAWNEISVVYTRYAFKPSYVVYSEHGRNTIYIVPESSYTISYSRTDGRAQDDLINAGTITVTFAAKPNTNFQGTTTAKINITPRQLLQDDVMIVVTSNHIYNGDMHIPTMIVTWSGTQLVEYKSGLTFYDFTAEFSNNVNASDEAIIDLTFHGNYSGQVRGFFTIYRALLDLGNIRFNSQTVEYDGLPHFINVQNVPTSSLTNIIITYTIYKVGANNVLEQVADGVHSISDCDWIIESGTYRFVATITLTNTNFYPSIERMEAELTINSISIDASIFSTNEKTFVYDGNIHKPQVSCSADFAEGVDYTVHYRQSVNGADIDPINVGTYYVVIVGSGNFRGNVAITFTITKASLDSLVMSIRGINYTEGQTFTYDGLAYTPTFTVYFLANGIKTEIEEQETALIISITRDGATTSDFIKIGTINITITAAANSNWTGSLEISFTIEALTINPDEEGERGFVIMVTSEHTYNGKDQIPTLSIFYRDVELTESDFEIFELKNNVDAGIATVTVKFKNNYSGTASTTFTINQAKLSRVVITIDNGMQYEDEAYIEYTGSYFYATYTIYAGDKKDLVVVDDYYTYNGMDRFRDKGSYEITFSAVDGSNFEGSYTVKINIVEKSLQKAVDDGTFTFIIEQTSYVYDGQAHRPRIDCIGDEKDLAGLAYTYIYATFDGDNYQEVSSREPVNVGTYYVVVTGTANYSGTIALEYKITPISLTYFRIALNPANPGNILTSEWMGFNANASVKYSGNQNNLFFRVYDNNGAIIGASYYSIKYYRNGVEMKEPYDFASAGEVTIEFRAIADENGVQNYVGTLTATFTINKIKVGDAGLELGINPNSFTYDGHEHKPTFTGKYLGQELNFDDYDILYVSIDELNSGFINAGTYKVIVTLKGNYDGVWEAVYVINPAEITKIVVEIDGVSSDRNNEIRVTYKGTAFVPTIRVFAADTELSTQLYTVSYSADLINAGNVYVTIVLNDNGEALNYVNNGVYATIIIERKEVSDSDTLISIIPIQDRFVYDGTEKRATYSVKYNGIDIEHTYEYANNINANDGATATIIFGGNYSGSVTRSFTITQATISRVEIRLGDRISSDVGGLPTIYIPWTGSHVGTPTFVVYDAAGNVVKQGNYTVTISGISADLVTLESIDDYSVLVTADSSNYIGSTRGTIVIRLEGDRPSIEESESFKIRIKDEGPFIYNGRPWKPNVEILYTNKEGATITLEFGVDFDLRYENNIDAGIGRIIIDGKEIYRGTTALEFTIERATLSLEFTFTRNSYVFDGANHSLDLATMSDGFGTIYTYSRSVEGQNSLEFIDVGSYKFIFHFEIINNNYKFGGNDNSPILSRDVEQTLTITKLNIDKEDPDVDLEGNLRFELEYKQTAYNGTLQRPKINVIATGSLLNVQIKYSYFYATFDGSSYIKLSDKEPINAGVYYVVIDGEDNIDGRYILKYEITKAVINFNSVRFESDRRQYTGQNQTIDVSGLPLTLGALSLDGVYGYSVSVTFNRTPWELDNCIAVGNYIFTLTFKINSEYEHNFTLGTSSLTATLEIYQVTIDPDQGDSRLDIVVESGRFVYNGQDHTPGVTVAEIINSTRNILSQGTDYSLRYEDNRYAGTAKIIITFIGNYSGSIERTFEIQKAVINVSNVRFESARREYTGTRQIIEASGFPTSIGELSLVGIYTYTTKVTYQGKTYSVSEFDCIDVGTYTFVLEFSLNLANEESKNFALSQETRTATLEIYQSSIEPDEDSRIVVEVPNVVYNGEYQRPTVKVFEVIGGIRNEIDSSNYTLRYTNNLNAGIATVFVTLNGNYVGTIEKNFEITRATISRIDITIGSRTESNLFELTYTGDEFNPSFVVYDQSGRVVPIDNYVISFAGGVRPVFLNEGTYLIYFTAKANSENHLNYTGTNVTARIVINKIDMNDPDSQDEISVTVTSRHVYNNEKQTPTLVVMYGRTELIFGTDFLVSYNGNCIDAGDYEIYIEFIGNYNGSYIASFTIERAIIDLSQVAFNSTTYIYDGEEHEIIPTNLEYIALLFKDDGYVTFKVTHNGPCKEVGTYTFVATFTINNTTNYYFSNMSITSTMRATLTIIPASLEEEGDTFKYELEQRTFIYDGNLKTPKVYVWFNGKLLSEFEDEIGGDYITIYENNRNAGRARVRVRGTDNFESESEVILYFDIEKAELQSATIYINGEVYNPSNPLYFTGEDYRQLMTFLVFANADGGRLQEVVRDYFDIIYSAEAFVNAGIYTITIMARDDLQIVNFSGSIQITITIKKIGTSDSPEDGKDFVLNVDDSANIYNGKTQSPIIEVMYGKAGDWTTLVAGVDFEIVFANAERVNAGKYGFTIKLIGNYEGTLNGEFTVHRKTISLANLAFSQSQFIYDGTARTLEITRYPDGYGIEYTLTTSVLNQTGLFFTEANAYIFVFRFEVVNGNYKFGGSDTDPTTVHEERRTLTITAVDISHPDPDDEPQGDVRFELSYTETTYDGSVKRPKLNLIVTGNLKDLEITYTYFYAKLVGESYIKLQDNEPINAGVYYVLVEGTGNFTGTYVLKFEILPARITRIQITSNGVVSTGSTLMVPYTGEIIPFSVKVFAGNIELTDSNAYTLMLNRGGRIFAWGEWTAADFVVGEIIITVTANSNAEPCNFTGTVSGMLIVAQKSINGNGIEFWLEGIPENGFIYDGSAKYPSVNCNDEELLSYWDRYIRVEYVDNVNAGTATVIIYGLEFFTGAVRLTFTISPAKFTDINIVYNGEVSTGRFLDVPYTGELYAPTVFVYTTGRVLIDSGYYEIIYVDNMIDAGIKTILVRAKFNEEVGAKNYDGEIQGFLNITPKDIKTNSYEFTLEDYLYYYTGFEIRPNVLCNNLLAENYDVKYVDNIEVGTATVKISGIGNYTGLIEIEFEIAPVALQRFTIVINGVSSTGSTLTTEYTGNRIYPEFIVIDSRGYRVQLSDLEITFSDILEVGSYVITITAKTNSRGFKNYTGILNGMIIVSQGLLRADDFELEETEFIFSGFENKPQVRYVGSIPNFSEFIVRYTNNINAGTAEAIIIGTGNYTGQIILTFNISRQLIEIAKDIKFYDKSETFDGSSKLIQLILPNGLPTTITVSYEIWTLTYDSRGNEVLGRLISLAECKNVGYYKFIATLLPDDKNYVLDVTTREAVLTITKARINDTMFTLKFESDEVIYNGKAHTPAIIPNQDFITFTYVFENNINAGVASITITGTGNYEGVVKLNFTINKAYVDISVSKWDYTSFIYDGTTKIVGLINIPDFVLVSYEGINFAIDAGEYVTRAVFEASENYTISGSVDELTWRIEKREVDTNAIVVPEETTIVFDGLSHTVEVTEIPRGIEIRFEFTNQIGDSVQYCLHAGVYYVKVLFIATSNYVIKEGSKTSVTVTLTIISRNFENGESIFTIDPIPNQGYTGEEVTPKIIVRNADTGEILTLGVDYEVQYLNNISIGTAIVIVTGIGNYSGEMSTTFEIMGTTASDANSPNADGVNMKEFGIIIAIFTLLIVVFVVTLVVVVQVMTKKNKNNDEDLL